MTSKVIGTVFQTPNNSGQFASGRGAICSIGYISPTLIASMGGNRLYIIMRRSNKCQTNT